MNWKLGILGDILLDTFGNSKLWRTKWFIFTAHTLSFLLVFLLTFLALGFLFNTVPLLKPIFLILLVLISVIYGGYAHFIYKK